MTKLADSISETTKKLATKASQPSAFTNIPGAQTPVPGWIDKRLRENKVYNEHVREDGSLNRTAMWQDRLSYNNGKVQSSARATEDKQTRIIAEKSAADTAAAEKLAYDTSHPAPIMDTASQQAARRRTAARQQRSGGRMSTVLSESQGLG